MLSIAKVTNTAQAASYYNSPDKYYEKDNADIGSCWGGKGAEDLGLEGTVVSTDFVKMLDGRINESTHLGRVDKEGEIKHVPGWDFTFSAPKSLSILALVGGDSRLVEAHIKASNAAMKHIESSYAKTRIKSDGKNEYVSVDNIIYASFVHTESRKHDPQLHSHNVVMNAVKDSDGQWRSLETLKMYEG
ncbi:MobF family relaxase, partial [Citrobacter freundii]